MVDLAGVARLLEPSFPALASAVCAGCLDEVLSNVGLDSLDMYSLFVQLNELADGSLMRHSSLPVFAPFAMCSS